MNRRDFLALLASAPMAALADGALPKAHRHLVLIELKGGNDGLNTLVPYRDSLYYAMRPSLALPADQCLPLDESRALHPGLADLMPLWQARDIAIVEGLGYANPNRSHFRSIDIWHSATDSDDVSKTGWLANGLYDTRHPVDAVVFGNRPAPVRGGDARFVAFDSLDTYIASPSRYRRTAAAGQGRTIDVLAEANAVGEAYRKVLATSPLAALPAEFPKGKFGRWLRDTARLLQSGLAPPLIKLHLQGFDTHANQLERHDKLMQQFAGGIQALKGALQEAGLWDKVLIMTYSEFGRRVQENASQGSDHGTAAPHFLIGGRVRGGLYGQTPSLDALQADDLVHTTDYRSLYRTVLEGWWQLPVQPAIRNRFHAINCLHS